MVQGKSNYDFLARERGYLQSHGYERRTVYVGDSCQ